MSTRPRSLYRFTALEILSIVMGVHLSSSAGAPAPDVRFVDATQTAGIEFEHRNSATPNKYLLETMGGGVALLDYDNDGRLDIFFTNGAKLDDQMVEGKLPDKADPAFWNRLYRQTSTGTFVDVTQKAGVSGAAQNQYGMGVAVGDYDNDGLQDIYVTNFGRNTLYRNVGDGTFADVTDRARVQGGGWSTSAGFFDYDNDGKLDLFVTRYLDWGFQKNRYCGEKKPGYRAYCHPDNFDPVANILYRNNGDGTFTDVSSQSAVAASRGKGLGVAFADYDGDRFIDVYVANDSVQSFLFHNNGNGTFEEVGLVAGVGFTEEGKTFAGMGTDFSDFDNDGHPDVFVTDLSNERYRLFRHDGDASFRDVSNATGIGGITLPFSGWSTRLFDYDNDGWKDIFVAQGHVMDTIEKTAPNLKYLQPPLLLRNDAGRFTRVMAGDAFQSAWAGRGAASGDIDNDGDTDLVVSNVGQKAVLLRNDGGNRNGWLEIRTIGTRSNRDGIGARVRVVTASGLTQHFTITTAAGYLSASDKRLIVGLGGDSMARLVEIRWPSGAAQTFENVKAREVLIATEPREPAHLEPGPMISRRGVLALLMGSAATSAFAQGISTRSVKPQPRGKPSGRPFLARFTDIAKPAGLTAPVIYGGIDSKSYIVEVVGCGVAFIDYDNDGWQDLLVLNGTRIEGAPAGTTNRLYKNNRDGTFTDVTERAGLVRTGWASAVTVGDYDNDGFDDLFITYYGHNVLYRNNGNGTFTDVTEKAGLRQSDDRYGSGCTWIDFDRDGHLDLFVATYLNTTIEKLPKPGENADCRWKGVPVNCGPRGLPPGYVRLFRNNGNGGFIDVSRESGIAAASGSYPMTAVAADFDNDGWPDIYVACDSTPSWLFRNQHDGTFREEALERGIALSEDGLEQAGMGIAVGDYDLDGNLDIFKTHFSDDTNVLYRNDGKGNFDDVTIRAGIGVETRFVGWGTGMVDLDNDGFPDLFLVTGSVYPEVERKLPAYPYQTPRLVFRNLGDGRFEELIEEAGPGIAATHASRGCAFGDFDNDGDVDVVIVNLNEPPSLLRNDVSGTGHWLKVLLEGVKSNRSAIGARVIAQYGGRKQALEVTAQSSFYSADDHRLHFGLGTAASADLNVRWPNGAMERIGAVEADQLVVIREGSGIVRRQRFTGAAERK